MLKNWLIIVFYIGIVSCTQEVIIYNPVDDNDEITYTEGSLTVYLESMEVATRSGWEYDSYFPSSDIYHDDSKIERAALIPA
ncbi:MAG: hypothetical protein LIP05_03120 [Tannerellaceae bacterium]|nr:hypothetical protein [Tannerellaceae bacterium]